MRDYTVREASETEAGWPVLKTLALYRFQIEYLYVLYLFVLYLFCIYSMYLFLPVTPYLTFEFHGAHKMCPIEVNFCMKIIGNWICCFILLCLPLIQGPSLVQEFRHQPFGISIPQPTYLTVCLYFELSLNCQITHQSYLNKHSLC